MSYCRRELWRGEGKRLLKCVQACLLAWLGAQAAGLAGVAYDAAANRVVVAGYPEEQPATLNDVLAADQKGGWGRVTYDQSADTFTVKAALWIGGSNDCGTFFQIGRPDHPRETLILHGDLVVTPPQKSALRYDGRRRISNRLTLGAPANPNLRATVKIACTRKNEYSVKVLLGREAAARDMPIGEWFMYNSLLTAAAPDTNHTYAAAICLSHAGMNFALQNSTFSWWDGTLFSVAYIAARGITEADRTVRGMTFENGGSIGGVFQCVDCVFRNLAVGRTDMGGTRCVFEGNQANVQITTMQTGVIFTDCTLGATKNPLRVPRSKRDEQWLRNYSVYKQASDLNLVLNPGIVERISVPVRVTDQRGQPVKEAAVFVDCPEVHEGLAVTQPLAVTDAKGLTPDDAAGRALVITKRALQPTDDPLRPKEINYVYQLRVQAPGYAEHRELIQPSAAPLPRPYPVKLRRI